MTVSLTDAGLEAIESLFPRFNLYEGEMVGNLSTSEKQELAELLRRVIVAAGSE